MGTAVSKCWKRLFLCIGNGGKKPLVGGSMVHKLVLRTNHLIYSELFSSYLNS